MTLVLLIAFAIASSAVFYLLSRLSVRLGWLAMAGVMYLILSALGFLRTGAGDLTDWIHVVVTVVAIVLLAWHRRTV